LQSLVAVEELVVGLVELEDLLEARLELQVVMVKGLVVRQELQLLVELVELHLEQQLLQA
jgi:hypothetical protein